ncbi:MAG: hypothetical protein NVS9B10_28350 [Nevskia sp.]
MKIRNAMVTVVRTGILAGMMLAGIVDACEEETPEPCSLDRACYGRGRALCSGVAEAFCAEPGKKCISASTLTMDPRNCVALIDRIHTAIRADTGEPGRHPER